jgi:hypothetical protein
MVYVYINGEDRTKYIDRQSLRYNQVLTQQVDTADFIIKYIGDKNYIPVVGYDVKIIDNGVTIFGGLINTIEQVVEAYGIRKYICKCIDYTKLLDHKLVIGAYQNINIEDIIKDIIDDFCPGFTYNNVNCKIEAKYIGFNYEQPSQCIKQLAELVNYDWYVDINKDVHFFAKKSMTAPFDLTDTSGYIKDTVVIRKDTSKLRNSIIVRGAEYLADTLTFTMEADGVKNWFETNYQMAGVAVTVTGLARTVGVDYINDADDYDCLYNFNEKLIKFKTADKPSDGAQIKIAGRPYLPVIVKYRDHESISTVSGIESYEGYSSPGEYEFKIIDKSIKTKEGARDRAKAELYAYARTLSEGSFETETTGLRTGQKIRVNITKLGIDEEFVINKVIGTMWTENKMRYSVSLLTTKTIGFIDFLQRLLVVKDAELTVKENEILDAVEGVLDRVTISETVSYPAATEVDEQVTINESIVDTITSSMYKWGPGYNAKWNLSQWN